MINYTPLHVHSDYSVLDGVGTIQGYINKAKELKIKSFALTEHGNLSSAATFHILAKAAGINPIIGCEVYTLRNREKHIEKKEYPKYSHLILLAKNDVGYRNLLKIVSESNVNGFYYKPIISFDELEKRSEGLYCLSACIGGELPKSILAEDEEKSEKIVKYFKRIFGKDYYLELMFNELSEQVEVNNGLIKLSKKHGVKCLITTDTHYVDKDDVLLQDIILAIRDNKDINSARKYNCRGLWFKNSNEIWVDAKTYQKDLSNKDVERYLDNTNEIKCDVNIIPKDIQVPVIYTNSNKVLKEKCLSKINELKLGKQYVKQFEHEYETITYLKYVDYFLAVSDIVSWARKNGIFVGSGRGSASGSLICYLLDITKIDPIKFDLMFERFVSKDRKDLPDIDVDFEDKRRDDVVQYIRKRFGEDKTYQIITLSTFGNRGIVRDIAKVFKIDPLVCNEISGVLDGYETIQEGIDAILDGEFPNHWKKFIIDNKDIFKYAYNISGNIRNYSRHPSGILITPKSSDNYVPLTRIKGDIVCGFSEGTMQREISALKLMKLDILGLRTCGLVKDCISLIKKTKGIDLSNKIFNIKLDDEEVFEEIRKGHTTGTFQFDSGSSKEILDVVQPEAFSDVCACVAMNRPGPLSVKEHVTFAENKESGNDTVLHKDFDDIFKETHATWCYQEQIMKLFMRVGFTLGEADRSRKALSKPSSFTSKESRNTEIDELKKIFFKKCKGRYKTELLEELWEKVKKYSVYTFNKSHSYGYGMLFYQCMYLKAKYPLEYACVLMNNAPAPRIMSYYKEVKRMGIKIKLPDVNKSKGPFTIEKDYLRYGLNNLRNIGVTAEAIVKGQPFKNVEELFELKHNERKLTSRVYYSLLMSGALKCFGDYDEIMIKYEKRFKKKLIENWCSYTQEEIDKELPLILGLAHKTQYFNKYAGKFKSKKLKDH